MPKLSDIIVVSCKGFVRKLFMGLIFALTLFQLPSLCDRAESPAYKYSEAANDSSNVWLKAIGSTLLISAAPFLLLFVVPVDRTKEKEPLLKVLLSFAAGGLLGDAFLHLIPHAVSPHDKSEHHGHSHSADAVDSDHDHDMSVGLWVLIGIITFMLVEIIVRGFQDESEDGGSHSHSHSRNQHDSSPSSSKSGKEMKSKSSTEFNALRAQESRTSQGPQGIKVAAYLNLAADFLHNFTDGLAIGASYVAGSNIGLLTTISILFHEIPHEIGDFAILIQSGCERRKAIFLQLFTAVGALLGTFLSLMFHGEAQALWILPFTAGGFIYIATVTIIPDLLEESTLKQSFKEVVALLLGVALMVFVADFE